MNDAPTPETVANGTPEVPKVIVKPVETNGVNGEINSLKPEPIHEMDISSPAATQEIKFDLDYNQEQESDARHEPLPAVKPLLSPDNASIMPPAIAVDSPSHPTPTPPPPLSSEVQTLEDIPMLESTQPTEEYTPITTNGNHDTDVKMDEGSSPVDFPPASNHSTSHTTPNDFDDAEDLHPTKRARKHSDADQASLAHTATPPPQTATPPPQTAATTITNMDDAEDAAMITPVPTPVVQSTPRAPTLDPQQYRFCLSVVRHLKKMKDAGPFLRPVDPVALNIPHYPSIIKNPMDLSTVERKIGHSNPTKRDPGSHADRYDHIEEFERDVRYIFSNCLTFNGPDHVVTQMSARVKDAFEKQMKNVPTPQETKPVIVKKQATPPPPPPPVAIPIKKALPQRRASTSVPVIRRSDHENVGRPKREIHPPPPKDLPYADAPKKHRRVKRPKDDGNVEQLRFCGKVIDHLFNKKFAGIANAFYEPVDHVKLNIPSYPRIVKKPMDMTTMRRKLESGEYSSAQKFHDDFKLMIRNCFAFNPPATPVNQAGIELQRVFDDKWQGLPVVRDVSDDDEEDEEDNQSDEDGRLAAIAAMERQIETMRGSLDALKSSSSNTKPAVKPKKKEKLPPRERAPVPSTSKPPPAKQPKASVSSTTKKKNAKKPVADDDTLTFEQKKDLSESISKLDESKLEKVISIIHEAVPEIRDSTEEIELEIDQLPAAVLTKLYNFVLRPQRAPATKRVRPGRGGTGTGGLKRKSMDEDAEAEKIRQLEERMALFENGGANGSASAVGRVDEQSSDSSSGSDSSGSDSE